MAALVFYSETARYGGAIDMVMPDGLGQFSGKTQAELESENGPLEVIEAHAAMARDEAKRTTAPVEIDEDRWRYWLEVLPPCKWERVRGAEVFHVSERITYSVVTWCVRIGKRFFAMDATDRLKPVEVVELVAKSDAYTQGVIV